MLKCFSQANDLLLSSLNDKRDDKKKEEEENDDKDNKNKQLLSNVNIPLDPQEF